MINRRFKRFFLWVASLLFLSACAYDNYDPPKSKLSGQIVYQGAPVHVASQQVTFRLYQTGFEKRTPITVQVAPDGTYQALVFNGNYQIVIPPGQGPFIQATKTDTVNIKVSGDTKQNIDVLPYYMITDPQFSASGRTVSAKFSLKQVITDANAQPIEAVALYINTTRFANIQNNVASQTVSGSDIAELNNIELSAEVPELTPTQDYVFGRIGVKIRNVEDRLFSKVVTIQIK